MASVMLSRSAVRAAPAHARAMSSTLKDSDAVIVSVARTPIGSFLGSLSTVAAPALGSHVIKAAVERAGIVPELVGEAYMGNVLSANLGQAPTRQAVLGAGLRLDTPSTTINKVCASGLKAAMLAASSVMLGQQKVVVAGGFESMSNVPFYLPKGRAGSKYGHQECLDGILKDGLWDVYNDFHMGNCGEDCAAKHGITREDQDAFAIESYSRAQKAWSDGKFDAEVAPITVKLGRGKEKVVDKDEEVNNVQLDKVPKLRPAFKKDGTVTAANASSLNDGAAAMLIMSAGTAKQLGVTPLAKICGFADAARAPIEFTVAPADAIPRAIANAGLEQSNIDYYEINEAFSVVSIANNRLLNLDPARVNVNGGAVAMGHPIGASGARILTTLVSVLKQNNGTYGVAGICNGGGGASAMVIEAL